MNLTNILILIVLLIFIYLTNNLLFKCFIKIKFKHKHYKIINRIDDTHANEKLLLLSDFLLSKSKGIYIKSNINKFNNISDDCVKNYIYKINSSPKEMMKFLNDFINYFDKQRKLGKLFMAYSISIVIGAYALFLILGKYINFSKFFIISYIIYFFIMLLLIWYFLIYKMYAEDNVVLKIINNYLEDILIDESDYRRTKIGFR